MRTIEETEEFIAEATKRLAGPMDNVERAMLVADRKEAREYLAALKRLITKVGDAVIQVPMPPKPELFECIGPKL